MTDTNVELAAPVPASDCFCEWLTKDEMERRETVTANVAQSRAEAVRLLRHAEECAGGDAGLLVGIAMAWKDLGRLN